MRKSIGIFLVGMVFTVALSARESDFTGYALTRAVHRAGVGMVQLSDPYLSSLSYSGYGVRLELTEQRYLQPDDRRFTMLTRLTGLAAATRNTASTAAINYMGGDFSWGLLYNYRKISNMVFRTGALAQADFAVKMNSRNVNNPVNLDMALNINGLIEAMYLLNTGKRTLLFSGSFETPLLGAMFVPYPGHSYYEMAFSKQVSEAIFFSSLHNRQGQKLSVAFEIPFRRTTLHMGWRYNHLTYKGGGPKFSFGEHSLLLGISYDLFRSSGRKSRFPSEYFHSLY